VTEEATVRSASNVLRLVLMLGERGRLRVTSVAEELCVAPSTAHRLLSALAQAGFAVQDEDRAYVPGPAYVRLRVPASHPDALVALVAPYLHDLAVATGETTHLMIMERSTTTVRFIHSVEGTAALRVASRTGAVIPAHLTSGGKALLAKMTDEEVRGLYPDGLPGGSRSSNRTLDHLLTELASIRANEIAENHEESEAGISAIGIAFQRHSLAAAISLSLPTTRYRGALNKPLEEHLRRTARKIEAQP
jgi:DNA-binding IclR family transcriptional regulator